MDRRATIRDAIALLLSISALGLAVVLLRMLPDVSATTVALALLLVVLGTATTARLAVAIVVSVVAMLAFNFFFLPPVGTLTIAESAELGRAVRLSDRGRHRQQSLGGGKGPGA